MDIRSLLQDFLHIEQLEAIIQWITLWRCLSMSLPSLTGSRTNVGFFVMLDPTRGWSISLDRDSRNASLTLQSRP